MIKQIQGWLRKSLGLPSTWSDRQWAAALRGNLIGGPLTTDALLRSSAVVACAGLIADSLASVPLRVTQHVPSGGIQVVTQSDAVSALLSLTWDHRSSSTFGCACLGNGWLVRDPDGNLRALDSWTTSAYIGDLAGRQQVWVREVAAGVGDLIPYEDTAHIRFRSSPHYILGYSPLVLASDSVLAALATIRMARALSLNASQPGITLQAPGRLSDKAHNNIKSSWEEAVGGDKQGSVAILEEGIVAKILETPTALDSQLVESLEWGAADVARLFNVPPTLIGLTKDSNKSSSDSETRQFATRCLKPWGFRISDRLSRLLLTDAERAKGLCVEHDLTELSLGQGKERSEYLSQLVNSGILKSNEARNSIGAEDDPDGDKLRFPSNTAPVGATNASQAQPN
jgi:HK97 family phage portal protein